MNQQKQIYNAMQSLDVIKKHTNRSKPMSEVEELVDEAYGLLNEALGLCVDSRHRTSANPEN